MINTKIEKIIKKKNDWFLYDQNIKSYGKYDWVILTLPAEQSKELISKTISFYPLLKKVKMKGCFSLMIGMNDPVSLDYDAAIIKDNDVILDVNSTPVKITNAKDFQNKVIAQHRMVMNEYAEEYKKIVQ